MTPESFEKIRAFKSIRSITHKELLYVRSPIMADCFDAAIRFGSDESGQDLVEYALIACVVSLAAITAMGVFAGQIRTIFGNIATSFTNAL